MRIHSVAMPVIRMFMAIIVENCLIEEEKVWKKQIKTNARLAIQKDGCTEQLLYNIT